jgi:hypothetical protein
MDVISIFSHYHEFMQFFILKDMGLLLKIFNALIHIYKDFEIA